MPIRRATVDDVRAIAEVHVASWRAAYRGQLPDDVLAGLSVERRADMWRGIARAHPLGHVLLVLEGVAGGGGAEDDDGSTRSSRVRGFAHLCPARDDGAGPGTGEVSAFYLTPSAWGRGQGRALMAACLDVLAERGYDDAVPWVLVGNGRARRFYEAGGWVDDGAQKAEDVAGVRVSEVRYRRSLRSAT